MKEFMGITWREFPGWDDDAKKLGFALFRRGEHQTYRWRGASPNIGPDCTGPALIARFAVLNTRNTKNAQARRKQPLPPKTTE
jgi:hypothetical protein